MTIAIEATIVMFCCTMANHLGLVDAIEGVTGRHIPIVNCSKCFTFWTTLAYLMLNIPITHAFAAAFALSWCAVWLELVLGAMDKVYERIYCKLYGCGDEKSSDPEDARDTEKGVSEL